MVIITLIDCFDLYLVMRKKESAMECNTCLLCGFVYEQELDNEEWINNSNECPCCGIFDTEMLENQ
jgi:hypothetical protein